MLSWQYFHRLRGRGGQAVCQTQPLQHKLNSSGSAEPKEALRVHVDVRGRISFILVCEHTGLRGMYCYKLLCIHL